MGEGKYSPSLRSGGDSSTGEGSSSCKEKTSSRDSAALGLFSIFEQLCCAQLVVLPELGIFAFAKAALHGRSPSVWGLGPYLIHTAISGSCRDAASCPRLISPLSIGARRRRSSSAIMPPVCYIRLSNFMGILLITTIAWSYQPSSQGSLKARSRDAQIFKRGRLWLIWGAPRRRVRGRQGSRSFVGE